MVVVASVRQRGLPTTSRAPQESTVTRPTLSPTGGRSDPQKWTTNPRARRTTHRPLLATATPLALPPLRLPPPRPPPPPASLRRRRGGTSTYSTVCCSATPPASLSRGRRGSTALAPKSSSTASPARHAPRAGASPCHASHPPTVAAALCIPFCALSRRGGALQCLQQLGVRPRGGPGRRDDFPFQGHGGQGSVRTRFTLARTCSTLRHLLFSCCRPAPAARRARRTRSAPSATRCPPTR